MKTQIEDPAVLQYLIDLDMSKPNQEPLIDASSSDLMYLSAFCHLSFHSYNS